MPPPEHVLRAVERFFAAVERRADAYRHNSFTYVAVKRAAEFSLIKGIVSLSTAAFAPKEFASENVRARRCPLEAVAPNPRAFVERLLEGDMNMPDDIRFERTEGGYHAGYTPFHPVGLQAQNRTNVLTIAGAQHEIEGFLADLDWELKAATVPYDSLAELVADFGLGILQGNLAAVEVVAHLVAAVDPTSEVKGKQANLRVRLANGLNTAQFALGYRVFRRGEVAERRRIEGADFLWIGDPVAQLGSTEIKIDEGDVFHCIATYAGVAEHFYWLGDVSTTQNARRAAYEAFDPQLQKLKMIISGSSARGRDARELEAAVAWIMWMLGFSVVHLGGTSRMQDAADLLVTTPSGHFAVIECTTGLLKAENKLALLHERAQVVRRSLVASGSRHLRLLTAMVTSKPRSDIEVDMEQAERLGIFVGTREYLDRAIEQTLIPQNADQLFVQAEEAVRLAQAMHTPTLPGM